MELILGGNSYKYDADTFMPIFTYLKRENIVVIPNGGHWIHAEKPKITVSIIQQFLMDLDLKKKYYHSHVTYGI